MLIVAKCCTCQQKCHTQPRSKGRTPSKHELYRRPPQTSSEMLSPRCTDDPRQSCTNHPHPSPGTTFPGPSMSSEAATSRSHLLAKLKTRRLWEVHPCMITRDMEQLSDHNLSCLSFTRLYFEWKNIEKCKSEATSDPAMAPPWRATLNSSEDLQGQLEMARCKDRKSGLPFKKHETTWSITKMERPKQALVNCSFLLGALCCGNTRTGSGWQYWLLIIMEILLAKYEPLFEEAENCELSEVMKSCGNP